MLKLARRLHEDKIEIKQPRVEGVPLTPSSQITIDGETASPGTLVSYSLSPPGHHTRALQSSLRSVIAGSEPAVVIPPSLAISPSPAIPPSPQAQIQYRRSSHPVVMPTKVTKTGKAKAASTSTASATASKMTEKTDIDDLVNSTKNMNLTDTDGCPMPILRGKFYEIIHMKTSKKQNRWKRKMFKKVYEVIRILVHPCVSEKQVKFEWVDQYTLKIMLIYPTWFYDFDKHYI